ncbi:helix-turn-helix domain-containing protein [Streptomyces sioyaensis]|uniref:helix-turn-helix domain-containing protein n=1 Tax=Streptomyces sioyaensis TaxID=67364 RepID=UPI0033ED3417
MDFRVQGTLQTGVDGAMSPLGGLMERRLLTCLPLNADRVVATRTLLGVRWPDEAPRTARKAIGNLVRYLRRGAALADRRAAMVSG